MSKTLIISIIAATVIVGCIIWDAVGKNKKDDSIKSNFASATATIISHDIPKRYSDTQYSVWIEYEYKVDGKRFAHKKKYSFKIDQENYFVGKTFPVIYNKTDPDESRLLIIATEFQEFNLVQPDSLKIYNDIII